MERRRLMAQSTVTSKWRTTLPKPVREALGLRPGDRVRYFVLDDEVRLVAVRPLRRLFGSIPYDGPPVTLREMERAIAEEAGGQ